VSGRLLPVALLALFALTACSDDGSSTGEAPPHADVADVAASELDVAFPDAEIADVEPDADVAPDAAPDAEIADVESDADAAPDSHVSDLAIEDSALDRRLRDVIVPDTRWWHDVFSGDVEVSGDAGADGRDDPGPGCGEAVAEGRVRGRDSGWSFEPQVTPLSTLELPARGSSVSDGPITAYEWRVETRPPGSTSVLVPNATVRNPSFFVDLSGRYVFSLQVTDQSGRLSCNVARVVAIARPDELLSIELTWVTPGDDDRFDFGAGTGSDLDLHLLHPNGGWDVSPWDCHWKNRVPNWGDPGDAADDPSMDVDDTDGWGPEIISLNRLEGTLESPVCYAVGVFYFSDHRYGPSDATVRIHLDGERSIPITRSGLDERDFWDVARICSPFGRVVIVDDHYPDGFPE